MPLSPHTRDAPAHSHIIMSIGIYVHTWRTDKIGFFFPRTPRSSTIRCYWFPFSAAIYTKKHTRTRTSCVMCHGPMVMILFFFTFFFIFYFSSYFSSRSLFIHIIYERVYNNIIYIYRIFSMSIMRDNLLL